MITFTSSGITVRLVYILNNEIIDNKEGIARATRIPLPMNDEEGSNSSETDGSSSPVILLLPSTRPSFALFFVSICSKSPGGASKS